MANLRDKGYGNSMEGYTPKKRHAREKKVTSGEATVQKGQAYQPTRSFDAVPEYGPVSRNNQMPNVEFSDIDDATKYYNNVTKPYREYAAETPQQSNLSLEEIQRRMKELEQAMANMDAKHNKFVLRKFGNGSNTEYQAPYYPYDESPVQPLADYNWDVAEMFDDLALEVGANDAYKQLMWQNYQKAAASGRAVNEQYERDRDRYGSPSLEKAINDENDYSKLFFDYNNLKNEYNRRLADYLQSIGR